MGAKEKQIKYGILTFLVIVISLLHYSTVGGHQMGLHLIHRELYFVPILLAAFWFGLKLGVGTSLLISIIYAPHIYIYSDAHGIAGTVAAQIVVFNLVALLLGGLSDRRKRQQAELRAAEKQSVLGRAAAAIGHEMNDILQALEVMQESSDDATCTNFDRDFQKEIKRLEAMVEALSSFIPAEQIQSISTDLNAVVTQHLEKHSAAAAQANVLMVAELDEKGCPSRLNPEKIGAILDDLIQNALEATPPGRSVVIRSRRGGEYCRLEVRDQGTGVKPEHLSKLFVPFFTTKQGGTGLALASGRKVLRDLGGDIEVDSRHGEGATFTLSIPREISRR